VLYHTSGTVEAGHRDTATGTGGGAAPFRTDDEMNYLHEVGVLPEVSARETLFEFWNVSSSTSADPDDGALKLLANWQLYWLETDEEVSGRRIDITE